MRKVEIVIVPEWGGRDAGKKFQIEETSALQAEKWFWRLTLVLKGTSAEIPEEIAPYGMEIVAIRGINSILAADIEFAKLEPLLDELLGCVKIIRDPSVKDRASGAVVATPLVGIDDIEEVRTVTWLRSEVLRIHTNFSLAAGLLNWVSRVMTSSQSPAS